MRTIKRQLAWISLTLIFGTLTACDQKKQSVSAPSTNPGFSSKACPTVPYDVTLDARNQCRWPFKNSDFAEDLFGNWFRDHHRGHWLGKTIYFDGLDKKKIPKLQLETATLSFSGVVFDFDHFDLKKVRLSMNGYNGKAVASDAVTYKVIRTINKKASGGGTHRKVDGREVLEEVFGSFHGDEDKDGWWNDDHEDCHRHARKIQIVRISFHLEKFVFGHNQSAADLLRSSSSGKGSVFFKVRHSQTKFRNFDGNLTIKGQIPGDCSPTPTPKPTPKPTPTPATPTPATPTPATPTPATPTPATPTPATPTPATPTPATPTPTPEPTPTPTPMPAPVVTIQNTSVGALTNSTDFQATFSANMQATFQCSVDGSIYTFCTSPFNHSGLADGPHNFSVVAINTEGTSSVPAHFGWTVDATVPLAYLSNPYPAGTVTTQTAVTFDFVASESATFQCSLDGAPWVSCNSPFTQSGLLDGSHSFYVLPTDLAGNRGAPVGFNWIIDTVPPSVTITGSSPDDNPSRIVSRTFTFTGSPDLVSFRCGLDDQPVVMCSSPFELANLTEGAHLFSVWGVDAAGNQGIPATNAFSIDTGAPVVVITSLVPSQPVTNSTTMQIGFSADESATFRCSLDNGSNFTCTSPASFANLNEGAHTFVVNAVDSAGNQSAPASYSWTVDTTGPVVTLLAANPAESVTNQTQINLQFTVNEPSTVQCSLDSQAAQACSQTVTYTGLAEGPHTITVVATDTAGNRGPSLLYSFSVDTSQPVMRIDSVTPTAALTNQRSMIIAFSASETTATTLCQLDGGAPVACVSPVTYDNLTDGSHVFSVTGQDAAGNTSLQAATYNWTVDTTPPVTVITSQTPDGNDIGVNSVTFTFAANEPATFECTFDGVGPAPCTSPVTMNGLENGGHNFTVNATDLAGNRDNNGATRVFNLNTTPLVISNVQVVGISRNGATITWTTNLPATTSVSFGPASTGAFTTTNDGTMSLTHSVTLTGLSSFTLYNYFVTSTSNTGKTGSSSQSSFRTLR